MGRVSLRRFQEAQSCEQEYWRQIQTELKSEDYCKQKRSAALFIFKELQSSTSDGCLNRVLEIGGGGNPMVSYLQKGKGIVIDPLARFYKIQLFPEQLSSVNYLCGIGEALPFKEDFFDGVLLYNCIDHGIAPLEILSESRRVLRRGGAIHLLVNTYTPEFIIFRKALERISPRLGDVKHPHYLRFNPIIKHLRNLGFVEVASHHDDHPYSRILKTPKQSEGVFLKDLVRGSRAVRAFYRLGN